MKKKYIQLGAVALLLAAMIGALVLLRSAPENTEPEAAPPEDAIYVGSGDVPFNRIEITNPSGTYELVTNPDDPEGGLVVKGWEKLSLDTYNLGLVSSSAKEMAVKEVIAENVTADELKTFGLDNPRAQVKIDYETGGPGIILFGDNAPGGEGVYVMVQGDSTIFLIMPSLAEPFMKPAVAYVNKTVTSTDPNYNGFDRITLSGTDYPAPIIIERTPETTLEVSGMSFGTHSITSPVEAGMDSQRGLEPLNSVYGLLAYDVVAVAEEGSETVASYGLDNPRAVISVAGSADQPEMTFTLRVSETDGNGNVRVMKGGSPVIYEMPEASLPWLGLTLFDYMEHMPLLPNIDTVSSVKVTVPGKTYVFTLTGESDELKVSLDGAELGEVAKEDGSVIDGTKNFRQYYQTLISATYEEETDQAPSEGAGPVVKIEYSYRSGGSDSVSFYTGPTRRAFMSVNGGTYYLTTSAYVDRVIEDTEKIASGKFVKSYY